ncbi:hypothetical protein HPB51_006163 [Rhipicephalus microplus]|uniref:Fe2OG dioxygenase domain-containing protein n=1 Tax=Rhipicephalus microplus TaxID=6941 RepID=A0A9J6E7A1_RHIMP|nr:prolyl 4-hydroxylase subunit alpha-1-like [Rhipicephalus microplus]KAH8029957.1 hypothetical protein HPB51_006163 [Rhipicephalus microplus]
MKRHIRQCETTWQRVALVSPPQHLELQDASLSPSEARATELVLLRFLRLSVFQAAADMLRNVRCPPPLVETGLSSWPTEDDIDGAATNVCRLQSAYGLTAAEVIATFCSPVLCNQLSSDDALWLGVHCSRSEPSAAAAWVKLGEDTRYADFFDYNLWELESSTPKWNSTSWKAVVSRPPETAAMWPYRDAFLGNERYSFPSDTRFGVLCRDSRESDARPSSRCSRCWLSSGNRGAATLSPFTVEELSPSEPRLWLVHDFLSHDECESLRREATELEPALVTEENGRDDEPDTRTAALAWLENNGSALRVYQRASALTGLTMESAEKLQVLNYAPGGHYNEHTDPLEREEEDGERLATLLVYLSDVKQGGSTAFPEANIAIRPRRGSALFWFNLKQETAVSLRQIDYSTSHGSCPVLHGSKWIATLWIRERSQPWDLDYSLRS